MTKKKNSGYNLEKRKKYFFQIGLVLALSFVLVAFEWAQFDETKITGRQFPIEIGEEVEIIPITYRKIPPPPPPPPPPSVQPLMKLVDKLEAPKEMEEFETEEELEDPEIPLKEIEEEEEVIDELPMYYPSPQVEPTFKGGLKELYMFLGKHLRYPEEAKRKGIEGKVYCKFIIMEDGTIGNIELLNRIGGGCDEEATRVVKLLPAWNPAQQGSRKVRTSRTLPIEFKIN